MPGGGTRTFLEPDHYEASLGQAQIQAVILPRDKFRARLTWAELHHSQVLRCEEDAPGVAYLQLAPGLAFITFTADSGPLPVWRGTEMQAGDIVFHGRGERLHQFTPGPFVWNVIAMDPAQLEYYGRALSGTRFSLPSEGRTLRPPQHIAAGLRRLHARICRLAETKPKIVSHFEIARAMEQGLIQMLVTCLTTASARAHGHAKRRHASIMVRFEEVLAEHLSRPLQRHELCALVAVSDHTLRAAGCATPIRTTQTSQKLSIASVSLSWSASARLTKRHLARPHRPISNTFPECNPRLCEFSQFLHSWRRKRRFSLGPVARKERDKR
jgi:hypothetical protein